MMTTATVVRAAIDLMQVPSRVRFVRTAPLPADVRTVLQIAAGDEATEIAAAAAVDRPRQLVREAAAFYIEQILLSPDADSYRVLGAEQTAPEPELRRNMALLLRWLHPDMHGDRSIFARRVTAAWENLKTPERRALYDRQQALRPRKKRTSKRHDGAGVTGRRRKAGGWRQALRLFFLGFRLSARRRG